MIVSEDNGLKIDKVVDNLPAAIVVLDRDTRILLANRMASMFAARGKQDFQGMLSGEAFHCKHAHDAEEGCGHGFGCKLCKVRQTIEDTFHRGQDASLVEAILDLENLGPRELRLSTIYLEEEDAVILAIEDITEQKKLEFETMEKNKLMAAVETAGAICHEMNQPLQVVLGYIETLLFDKGLNQNVYSILEEIRVQTLRLRDITKQLHNLKSFKTREYVKGSKILDMQGSSA